MTDIQVETHLPKNVLVVMAHADDIDFGVVGSAAHWRSQGASVTYCIVTNNASGSNDPNTNLEELITTRKEEQTAAAKIVGVETIYWLDYPDGYLEPNIELRRDITRIIRTVRPDRVVTFDPELLISKRPGNYYINHPDHHAVGVATLYATFPSAETRPIFPELLAEGLEPHKVIDLYFTLSHQADTIVNITEHIHKKMDALRCHKSQLNEDIVERVASWNAEAGEKYLGGGYGEIFRVIPLNRPEQD